MSSLASTRRYTLTSSERVKSKKLAEELFKKGSSFFVYPFIVRQTIISEDLIQKKAAKTQLLIAIPKKKIRKAVHRNLLKRRVREAYRLHKYILWDELKNKKIAFSLVYVAKTTLNYDIIEEKIKTILELIHNNEEHDKN